MITDASSLAAAVAALADLGQRQIDSDRLLAAEGAGHIVHDLPLRTDGRLVALESRPWRLDPIPLVVDGSEFVALADAAIARMQMLEAILRDVYGRRSLLTDAVIDPTALWASPAYRLAAFGRRPGKRWMTSYAVDVVRGVDGSWHAVRDLTDAPPGVGYSMLGRLVTGRVHRDLISRLPAGRALRSLDPFADRLRDGLADVAATKNPRIVVLSGGVDHPSFVEQSYLATRLGLNLAEGADLVVRQRRVWLRSLAGLEPVDVLFRRLEDDRVDPLEVNAEGTVGVPGLLLAARTGGVTLANDHGSGVIEDPSLASQWDDAGAWLTGRATDYQGVAPLTMLGVDERTSMRWATQPCYDGERLVERAVVLRLHLVAGDQGVDVLQGGSARVLLDGDDPITPTSATAKDVWVVGGTVAPPAARRRDPLPQVDLVASVPTRAAEALYWSGRAMERAELVARAIEVVLDRTSGAVDAEVAEAWVGPGLGMLAAIGGVPSGSSDGDRAGVTFVLAIDALARQLGSFLAEASSVREFFSVTGGRVLARLADARGELKVLLDGLDLGTSAIDIARIDGRQLETVLIDLASLVGLWSESVVHGPAWRFGEVGRRIERVFGVIDGVRGAFGMPSVSPGAVADDARPDDARPDGDGAVGPAVEPTWVTAPWSAGSDDHRIDFQRRRVVELVLACNESLVAYRRRHRSDVEFEPALHLVIADSNNPRSVAAALRSVAHQAHRLSWQPGVDQATALAELVEHATFDDVDAAGAVLADVWNGADLLARDVVGSHLVSPVDPRIMGRS